MINNTTFLDMINATTRRFSGRVDVYNGTTLAVSCNATDKLKDFKVERVGENKFFGYGISQKLTTHFIDIKRELNITKNQILKVWYGVNGEFLNPYPNFFVDEISRDENTNELTITAYDAIGKAANHTVSEIALTPPYNLRQFAEDCGRILGVPVRGLTDPIFELSYDEGGNFNGNETIRSALNAIADLSQTIYYIDSEGYLIFKPLTIGTPVATIDKTKYMELKSEPIKTLKGLAHITELGDNVIAVLPDTEGEIHYIRNNPFLELRTDVGSILESRLANIVGLSITPFTCSWRGNFLIEIGDAISLQTKDNNFIYSYALNDAITFNGGLFQESQWVYESNENETANPSTLSDVLNETFAKVDKVNRQIDLVVKTAEDTQTAVTQLQLNIDGINASVSSSKQETSEALNELHNQITTVNSRVDAAMTAEDVKIEIQKELVNGTSKVVTATGFTFDDTGLTVSKTNSEITTTITEDGMQVFKGSDAVLTANNKGVDAANLHATTYLIIGTNSRLEDFGYGRTGCFFIG